MTEAGETLTQDVPAFFSQPKKLLPIKTYIGDRDQEAADYGPVWVAVGGARRKLPLRLDLRNHSPTGFAWGYLGSGPAQLALAICADALGDDQLALAVYMEFKSRVTAKLPMDEPWSMTDTYVGEIVDAILDEQPNQRRRLRAHI